jgi:MFS family permease
MLVVIVALTLVIIRGDPEDLGLKPFGHENGVGDTKAMDSDSPSVGFRGLGLTEAMKTYSFWLFLIACFICGGHDFLILTHLIPMVTDYGISPTTGANMLAWIALTGLAGLLFVGPVADLIGTKIPFAFTFFVRIFLFILVLKFQTVVSFYVFACVFGFTVYMGAPLTPMLVGRLYGFMHIGLMAGFFSTIHHLGGGFWVYVGGLIFDHTGSYRLAFILSTITTLIAFFSMLLIRERKHQSPQ